MDELELVRDRMGRGGVDDGWRRDDRGTSRGNAGDWIGWVYCMNGGCSGGRL